MKYIDSGERAVTNAVGHWLQSQLTNKVIELRWQSGFFSADGLHPFSSQLKRMAASNLLVHALIGSNDGETLEAHVKHLASELGIPRSNAKLGIVSFAGAYFHPKTSHLKRDDGSQAAYVGSANLTLPGLTGQHVEAGIILDTALGDTNAVLDEIAKAIDDWFTNGRVGLEAVNSIADISKMTTAGILSVTPPPRVSTSSGSTSSGKATRPRLQPLLPFPRLGLGSIPAPSTGPTPSPVAPTFATNTAVPLAPYPPYLLFASGASAPTIGVSALTGAQLPGGNSGLIIKLNRDSARHWSGGTGTSNISIPVATLSALRFGIYNGARPRPRCEFPIEFRYIYSGGALHASSADTNIMAYGFSPGDTGHGDVRLVVPKPPAAELLAKILASKRTPPSAGQPAFLEWPTMADPSFRLSLLEPNSALSIQADTILASSPPVGGGACWLAPGISPSW